MKSEVCASSSLGIFIRSSALYSMLGSALTDTRRRVAEDRDVGIQMLVRGADEIGTTATVLCFELLQLLRWAGSGFSKVGRAEPTGQFQYSN